MWRCPAAALTRALSVYNWQFVNCLRVWALVLASAHRKKPSPVAGQAQGQGQSSVSLGALVYPFVQLCFSTLQVTRQCLSHELFRSFRLTAMSQLLPAARFYPLRLVVCEYLSHVAKETGMYIPVASQLLPVLYAIDQQRRPKPSTSKPPSLGYACLCLCCYVASAWRCHCYFYCCSVSMVAFACSRLNESTPVRR